MNTSDMNHEEFRERLAAYVAGGLEPEERAAMSAHAARCVACASALNEAVAADESLAGLFEEQRPAAGFEDRMVRGLWMIAPRGNRLGNPFGNRIGNRMKIHPAVWRATAGLAAALVLGSVGYVGNTILETGNAPWVKEQSHAGHVLAGARRGEIYDRDGDGVTDLDSFPTFGVANGLDADGGKSLSPDAAAQRIINRQRPVDGPAARTLDDFMTNERGETDKLRETTTHEARPLVPLLRSVAPVDGAEFSGVQLGVPNGGTLELGGQKLPAVASTEMGRTAGGEPGRYGYYDAKGLYNDGHVDWSSSGFNGANKDFVYADASGKAKASGNFKPSNDLDTILVPRKTDLYGAVAAAGQPNKAAEAVAGDKSFDHTVAPSPDAPATPFFANIQLPRVTSEPPTAAFYNGGHVAVAGQYFKPTEVAAATAKPETEAGGAMKGVQESNGRQAYVSDLAAVTGEGAGLFNPIVDSNGDATVKNLNHATAEQLAAAVDGLRTSDTQVNSPPQPQPQPPQVQQEDISRKIIRTGEMEFEVEGFDTAYMQITKIVMEERGFVSSTNSEKLPNGKVKGTTVVRVPPEHLDTLVLKLRALGDLKSQKISAQDVTKAYTDLESELRAGRAMEERLLNIIKTGKGEVKDLLEAEKQLGVYREKIEKLEGEIRYYNNLVALSTLSITAYEKDIKTPAFASQTEQVSMGMESEQVEKARADALKAIDEAKGRIIESNLKKYDAGQLAATIVAEVSPDASGPLLDRLRQLGKVARLDIDRKQTTPTGTTALPGARVEKQDTRFSISIYNLANIAPRQTTNLNLAVANVEDAYKAILASVEGKSGRIVSSSLNRQKPEQTTATIGFEVPSAEADATLSEIRRDRDVMTMNVTENPDTANVTTAKRGFTVQVYSLATVAPRETEQLVLTTRSAVSTAFKALAEAAKKADGRILVSQLNEQDANLGGTLDVEIPRLKELDFRTALAETGIVLSRNVTRSADAENTVDSKLRVQIRLMSLDRLAPRETQTLGLAAKDVPAAYQAMVATLSDLGARVITSQLNEQNRQNITGTLDFEVLADKREAINKALAEAGVVYSRAVTRSSDTVNTVELKFRIQVSLVGADQLPPRQLTRLMMEVPDADRRADELRDVALKAGGRVVAFTQSKDSTGRMSSHVVIDVPLDKADGVRVAAEKMGTVRVKDASENLQTPDGKYARAQIDVTLGNAQMLVGNDEGLGASVTKALSTSIRGLLYSVQFLVAGLLLVGPWAVLVWGGWRLIKRKKKVAPPAPAA